MPCTCNPCYFGVKKNSSHSKFQEQRSPARHYYRPRAASADPASSLPSTSCPTWRISPPWHPNERIFVHKESHPNELIQSSPLVWSTDVRSIRLYGQFLIGPNHRIILLISNPNIRSARLYGQFSLDKTWTLQAGSSVSVK